MSVPGRGGAAALALALGLAGCAAPGPGPGTGTGPLAAADSAPPTSPGPAPTGPVPLASPLDGAGPPGLTGVVATLRQYRRDVALRRVQVTVTNTGPEPVTVTSVRLLTEAFTDGPAAPKDTQVRPGRRVDLPVPLGAARCAPSHGLDPARVRLALGDAGGSVTEHVLGAADDGLLDRIRRRECDERRLRDTAVLSLGPPWETLHLGDGEPTLRGVLRVERAAPDTVVTLVQVAGSVLFTVRVEGQAEQPVLTLDAGAPAAERAVTLRTARCDGHAIAESKRSHTFPAWVRVGSGEAISTTLSPDDEGRRALDELVRLSCRAS